MANINENHVLLIEGSCYEYVVEVDTGEIVEFCATDDYIDYIDVLISTRNFALTHTTVESLDPYTQFLSNEEIIKILTASIENNQIRLIINDEDIKQFINKLFENKMDIFDLELKEKIKLALEVDL